MAIFPFILVNNKAALKDKVLINHETIHLKQELELLVLPFYILYFLNYLVNYIKYRNHNKAYLNIVFEREAYVKERDLTYLKKRGLWFWRFYLTSNS